MTTQRKSNAPEMQEDYVPEVFANDEPTDNFPAGIRSMLIFIALIGVAYLAWKCLPWGSTCRSDLRTRPAIRPTGNSARDSSGIIGRRIDASGVVPGTPNHIRSPGPRSY